ncbi:MAG: hypothetical protein ACE5Q6_22520 [Dehalococcoidia bacterium]
MARLMISSGKLNNPASALVPQVVKEATSRLSGFLDRVANRNWRVTSGLEVYSPFNISKTIPGEFPNLNGQSEREKNYVRATLHGIYGI